MSTSETDHPHLRGLIRQVPDFPKPAITFLDIMPLFLSFNARRSAFALMQEKVADLKFDLVVGLESRGFFFGQGVADRMQLGFAPARKKGKLPPPVISYEYCLEYGVDTVEISTNSVRPGQLVLIIDDVLATGGSAGAVCELVKKMGGIPTVLVLIELEAFGGRFKLIERFPGIRIESVLLY